jgi:hypothetical protein
LLVESLKWNFTDVATEKKTFGFPFDAGRVGFNVPTAGKMTADVTWTTASNKIVVTISHGTCQTDGFYARTCDEVKYFVLQQTPPATLDFGNVAAGDYTIWLGNQGDQPDSGTAKVYVAS